MILKCIPKGMFGSNCYIAGNAGEVVVIDPGADIRDITDELDKESLKVKYIILTHTHIDHILSVDKLREATGAKVAVHRADASALSEGLQNGSALFFTERVFKPADILLEEGDRLEAGGVAFEILHTPGHTPGGICILAGNNLFTGDTLFKLSKGRTDLANGDEALLDQSLEKLMRLDDGIIVHPGHMSSTTIGYERKHNPFCRF